MAGCFGLELAFVLVLVLVAVMVLGFLLVLVLVWVLGVAFGRIWEDLEASRKIWDHSIPSGTIWSYWDHWGLQGCLGSTFDCFSQLH